jgi:hypothetical protein
MHMVSASQGKVELQVSIITTHNHPTQVPKIPEPPLANGDIMSTTHHQPGCHLASAEPNASRSVPIHLLFESRALCGNAGFNASPPSYPTL